MKKWALVSGFLLLVTLLTGCATTEATPTATNVPAVPAATTATAPSSSAATPTKAAASTPTKEAITRGGTLRIGVRDETPGIDPHLPNVAVMFPAWFIYDGLVHLDSKGKVLPELAESWDVSPDGLTVTFKLKKGVKFHDGTDFNAEVVKFNMERLANPAARFSFVVEDVARYEVIDNYTIKFHMKNPSSALLSSLGEEAGMIVSPAAVAKYGEKFSLNPVGGGGFQMDEWVPKTRLAMKRFPQYWNADETYLDRVVFTYIPDPTVRIVGLRTGTLDWIDEVPELEVENLKKDSNVQAMSGAGWGFWAIRMNMSKSPLDNKPLRQAISMAIDREGITKAIFAGVVVPGTGPISPTSWAWDPNLKGVTRDLGKAKAKLAEAGFPNGLELTLLTYTTALYTAPVEAIQAQLAEIGIKVKLDRKATAATISAMDTGSYQLALSRATDKADPDPILYNEFHSKAPNNNTGYANPKVDELLERARRTFSLEERKKLYSEASAIILEDSPQAIITYRAHVVAMTSKVKNYVLVPSFNTKYRLMRHVWLQK